MKNALLLLFLISITNCIYGQHSDIFLNKSLTEINLVNKSFFYNKVFDDDGEKKLIAETKSITTILDVNYGLTKTFNLSINAPFLMLNKSNGESSNGTKISSSIKKLGDLEFGIDYLFMNNEPWKIVFGITQSIPTGINNQEIGLNTGYSDNNQKFKIKVAFEPSTKWNFIALTGFNNHNKGFGDEIFGKLEINYLASHKIKLNINFNGVQPFENGDQNVKPLTSGKTISEGHFYGLYAQHTGFFIVGSKADCNLNEKFGFFASISKSIKAQNYPSTLFLQLGLHYLIVPNKIKE